DANQLVERPPVVLDELEDDAEDQVVVAPVRAIDLDDVDAVLAPVAGLLVVAEPLGIHRRVGGEVKGAPPGEVRRGDRRAYRPQRAMPLERGAAVAARSYPPLRQTPAGSRREGGAAADIAPLHRRYATCVPMRLSWKRCDQAEAYRVSIRGADGEALFRSPE